MLLLELQRTVSVNSYTKRDWFIELRFYVAPDTKRSLSSIVLLLKSYISPNLGVLHTGQEYS